jgi:hypothetical protein
MQQPLEIRVRTACFSARSRRIGAECKMPMDQTGTLMATNGNVGS